MDERDGYQVSTQRDRLLSISNTVLLSLVSIPENGNLDEEVLVTKAVRIANELMNQVKNFKLD